MTIAVSLKVNDGVVLAADSASTIMGPDPGSVENVYNHANKIFNLRKGLPVGMITWGLGGIDGASISTLAKDLRRRFSEERPGREEWKLDPDSYTIEHVAERVREFFYEERYEPFFRENPPGDDDVPPVLGFIVAGYSPAQDHAEEYLLVLAPDGCEPPSLIRPLKEVGVSWSGQPEAITRLLNGAGTDLPAVLENDFGVDAGDVPDAMEVITDRLGRPIVNPAMPFQDAIDLAEFLVDVSIKWSRFMPGSPTVGGPIETAAISKHEGFKWVKRKHYFEAILNPEVS